MASDTGAVSSPSAAEQKQAAERVRMLYEHAPAGFAATLVSALLVVFGLWSETERPHLLAWLICVIVVTAARVALHIAYQRRSRGPEQAQQWERLFSMGSGIMGLTWGVLGTVLFPAENLLHQMPVLFVVGGMATGATGVLGSSRLAFYSFFVPSLPPLVVQFLIQGGTVYLVLGVMLALFTVMLVTIFRRFHQYVLTTIRIRFENDALVEDLHRDVTECKRIEHALRESEEHYRNLVEMSNDLIWAVDREGLWTYLNPNAAWRIYGYASEEMLGRPFVDFVPVEQWQRDLAAFQRVLAGDNIYQHETIHLRKDGTPVVLSFNGTPTRDAQGNIIGTTGTASDITERKQTEERIWHIAHHDALTNLPNRRLFQDRLDQAMIQARRKDLQVGLMLLDLDRFKPINDSYGHNTGDIVLMAVAERLKLCVRQSDTVSRQGGDEFAIILPELSGSKDAAMIAEKILHSIAQPICVHGNEFHLSASIGIAVFPADAEDAETLLKQADASMYQAKEQGRNNCRFARERPPHHGSRACSQ